MEKEKMIEELEAILEREQIKIANTVEEFAKLQKVGITRCNAEALYNANCRIVPEGSVVVRKEELQSDSRKDFTTKVVDELIDKEKEKTAEGIFNLILARLNEEKGKDYQEVIKSPYVPQNETKKETIARHKGYIYGLDVSLSLVKKYHYENGVEVE